MRKRPSLLISVPIEPDGAVCVHLAHWLLNVQRECKDWGDIECRFVQCKPVAATRNLQVRQFLEDGPWDYCLFVDDDAVPDTASFRLLLEDIKRPEVDAVGGWSVAISAHGPQPVVQKYQENGGCEIHREILAAPAGLHPIPDGGIGAHCLMVKRATMERFRDANRVWFKDVLRDWSLERWQLEQLLELPAEEMQEEIRQFLAKPIPRMGSRVIGQDVWFCRMCHDLGLNLYVDTRVLWGHVKLSDIRTEYVETLAMRQQLSEAKGTGESLQDLVGAAVEAI